MPNYFRRSIVDAGKQIVAEYNERPRDFNEIANALQEVNTAKSGDYSTAIELINTHGHQLFDNTGDFNFTQRCILINLIKATRPSWISSNQTGRRSVIRNIKNKPEAHDIIQCFEDAGLLDSSKDHEVTKWWKLYSKFVSSGEELSNLEIIGLEGEEKTKKYEREYLQTNGINKEPVDMATEDPAAGYDILSWRKDGNQLKDRLIEAKMTEQTIKRFFLSRNAFNTALKNKDAYVVYLWTPGSEKPEELFFKDLMKHIPKDRGSGTWTKVEITI